MDRRSDPDVVLKRKCALKKVRSKRNALATAIRKNKHILDKEIDIRLVDDMYEALGGLAKAFPGIFGELAKAIQRYDSRREK